VNDENWIRPGVGFNDSCWIGLNAKDELAQIHEENISQTMP
jgi:hypothetical protein